MKVITRDNARRLLCELIARPSVNPMGGQHPGDEPVERPCLAFLETVFAPYAVGLSRQRCGPCHENLLVEVPGEQAGPATLLESHVDTVPADDWLETAFHPRVEADTVYGRGACDDKGPLAAMVLAVQEVLEGGRRPPFPVLLLAAGDEEYAQTGIKAFVGENHRVGRALFGEPTGVRPILQHKGTVRWDLLVRGRSAHSSQPELGCDAIGGAVEVLGALRDYQQQLQRQHVNLLIGGPTLTVTRIHGGRTRNAVADECTLSVDFRVLPGMPPGASRQALIDHLSTRVWTDRELRLEHADVQLETPPLSTAAEDPFSQLVLAVCRSATGKPALSFAGAPYGTDAAWVAEGCPAIVLGPGSVDHAHAVDERVDLNEVVTCAQVYYEILVRGA